METEPDDHHPTGRPPELTALAARLARGLRAGDRPLLVACSGGLDSTALAAAAALALPGEVVLGHVDHAVRAGSAGDASHVERLAVRLGVACRIERLGWTTGAPRGPAEDALRARRYRALASIARRSGCATIATAHHLDDQVETLLFRLLRGTGWRGYLGIPERRRLDGDLELWRPLLDVPRAALRAALVAASLDWVEDPTNADPGPARNRLRHDLLPRLRARTDGAIDARLLALRDTAGAAERLAARIATSIDAALARDAGTGAVTLPLTGDEPAAVLAEAARRIHRQLTGAVALERWVGRVVDLAAGRPGRRLDAARGLRVRRTRTGLAFEPT